MSAMTAEEAVAQVVEIGRRLRAEHALQSRSLPSGDVRKLIASPGPGETGRTSSGLLHADQVSEEGGSTRKDGQPGASASRPVSPSSD